MIWHAESTAAVLSCLGTDRDRGLTPEMAEERLRIAGENLPGRPAPRSLFRRFLVAWRQPAVLLTLAVALIGLAVGVYNLLSYREADLLTPAAVLGLLILRCLLTALLAGGEDRELPAVRTLMPTAHPVRDRVVTDMPAPQLVPGDVIELSSGDLVPADCRLLSAFELHCDESAITGDPLPVPKNAGAAVSAIAPLTERVNMLYAGSVVLRGRARAVVVETGRSTEQNRLALLRAAEKESALPLQNKPAALAKGLAAPALLCGLAAAVLGIVTDMPLLTALLWGAALAAAVSTGELTSIVPGTLLAGARRMASRGAVVNRAAVTEELGRTTVLFSDKTGSFTTNDMTLARAFAGGRLIKLDDNPMPPDINSLIQLTTLCTNPEKNATDEAILRYAARHGMQRQELSDTYPRMGVIPLDPERRRMTAVHLIEGRYVVIVKGAPETLLPLCGELPEQIADAREFMGAEGLRVLAVAYKYIADVPAHCFAEELERDLNFVGLLGLVDPPRQDTAAAVAECRSAGIRPVMLTGDSLSAAVSVARRVGLIADPREALEGAAVAAMSDGELQEAVDRYSVYARVSPTDRLRIVKAWKERGALVTVTGDDADDVSSLRAADIGCAMMRGSTDVAASAADVAVTDPKLSTLTGAIRTGRAVFDNVRQGLFYWIARYLALPTAVLGIYLGWREALLSPALLLWVSIVTGIAGTALRHEPPRRDAMRRPPRDRAEGLFARGTLLTLLQSLSFAAVALCLYSIGGRAAAWVFLTGGQALLLLGSRTLLPLGQSRLGRAPLTWLALIGTAALLTAPLFIPALQPLTGAAPDAAGWEWAGIAAAGWLLFNEGCKWIALIWRKKRG